MDIAHQTPAGSRLPVVYIFATSCWIDSGVASFIALTDDGDVLGTHICSSLDWARHDLHGRPGMAQAYIDKYGRWNAPGEPGEDRYELVVLAMREVPPLPVLEAWLAKNPDALPSEENTRTDQPSPQ